MTFQTNFIGMLDHVGTHVDAFRHVNPNGKSVDEMPLDLFMGKAVCFDLRHIPDLGDITVADMETAEAKPATKVDGQSSFCTPASINATIRRLKALEESAAHRRGDALASRSRFAHARRRRSFDRQADRQYFAQHRLCRDLGISHGSGSSISKSCSAKGVPVLRRPSEIRGRLGLAGARLRLRQRLDPGGQRARRPDRARDGEAHRAEGAVAGRGGSPAPSIALRKRRAPSTPSPCFVGRRR